MANEKRLIDADALKCAMYSIKPIPDSECIFIDVIIEEIDNAQTVDAVVLPCKVGTQIWLTKWRCSGMRWLKLIEPKPRTINYFDITKDGLFANFKDGYVNVMDFGKTVFLSKEEAKSALAKMDGGNDDE